MEIPWAGLLQLGALEVRVSLFFNIIFISKRQAHLLTTATAPSIVLRSQQLPQPRQHRHTLVPSELWSTTSPRLSPAVVAQFVVAFAGIFFVMADYSDLECVAIEGT